MPDVSGVAPLIRDAATRFILPHFQKLQSRDKQRKAGGKLVTFVDHETEAYLTENLAVILPGSVIIGEEAYEDDPSIGRFLTDAEWVWVLDPVDGTHNFANGKPLFGVMVALVHNGKAQHSWLYDVPNDVMATATSGQGAFLEGQKLTVEPVEKLSDLTVQVGGRIAREYTEPLVEHGMTISRIRCIMHDALRVATGKAHAAVHFETTPWDHIPVLHLLEEAGGYVAASDGSVFDPTDRSQNILVAADEARWHELAALIFNQA